MWGVCVCVCAATTLTNLGKIQPPLRRRLAFVMHHNLAGKWQRCGVMGVGERFCRQNQGGRRWLNFSLSLFPFSRTRTDVERDGNVDRVTALALPARLHVVRKALQCQHQHARQLTHAERDNGRNLEDSL